MLTTILPSLSFSDNNLQEVCSACRSHCIVAHVRAASPGSVVSRENCHPFKCGLLLFCHNGRIDGFWGMRKAILNDLTDTAYLQVRGTTDSEVAFAMILDELERDGGESPLTKRDPFEPERLVNAVRKTIEKLEFYQKTLDYNRDLCRNFSTLNFSLTDGNTMVISRYCDQHLEIPAPSLYFALDSAKALRDGIAKDDGAGIKKDCGPGDGSDSSAIPGGNGIKKAAFAEMVESGMKRATSFQDFGDLYDKYSSMDVSKMAFCVSSDPLTFWYVRCGCMLCHWGLAYLC